MLRSAGWVILFASVYLLAFAGSALVPLSPLMRAMDEHSIAGKLAGYLGLFLIFAGPATLALIVGYAASAASGRGPGISVVVGLVAGCSMLLMSLRHPTPAIPWYILLYNEGTVALGASLGGFLHQWLSKRRRAEEATGDPVR